MAVFAKFGGIVESGLLRQYSVGTWHSERLLLLDCAHSRAYNGSLQRYKKKHDLSFPALATPNVKMIVPLQHHAFACNSDGFRDLSGQSHKCCVAPFAWAKPS